MQIEREIVDKDIFDEATMKTAFDEAETFTKEKMESALQELDVTEVHVFKATPFNLKFAALRKKYPDMPRRKLRQMMKVKK